MPVLCCGQFRNQRILIGEVNMAVLKCKMCGGDLNIGVGESVGICEFCGTKQTVPTTDNEKKITLFQRANRLRFACEFDKAAGIYESIVAEFPEEAEAYWGLILCKYGIEYVDDPATAKKIPTCHRSSFDSVMDDSNFELVMENADPTARGVYRAEAKQIEELRKSIIEVSSREEPYDIFICYKETAPDGDRTIDSVIAQDVYDALTEKGYRVFFSRITLEDKLGQEYEPYIFAALNSAKIMLAFGTDYEYYNAVWVKNEWSRFLQLIAKGEKKTLIPCYKNIDAYDMPKEFAKLQAQDMGKVGAIQDLLRGIAKIITGNTEMKSVSAVNKSTGALTKRGYFFLEDGDFKTANEYFDKSLDENPEDSKAYVGKVLAMLRMSDISEIENNAVHLSADKNFERAIRFASESEKDLLVKIKENADRKWFAKCFANYVQKIANIKEIKETRERIKQYAASATVEGYQKAVELFSDAYNRRISDYFTADLLCSYKRQLKIIKLFCSDIREYTIEDIRKSKYFKDDFIFPATLRDDLGRMLAVGSVEKGKNKDTYGIKGLAEKIAQQEKENEYMRAMSLMLSAKSNRSDYHYFTACEIFESLGNFRDSEEKATECKRLGEQLKSEIEAEIARKEELRRQDQARQEAERKAVEGKRLAEIKVHNENIALQIAEAENQLAKQKEIYAENSGKIFGTGAKLKKTAKAEIARLESAICSLKSQLK